MDIDEDALWRAVASICGALTALTNGEKDITKGLAHADVWLDYIDPFALKGDDDDGVKFTLERGK